MFLGFHPFFRAAETVVYHVRLLAKSLNKGNKSVYYFLKWTVQSALAYAVFLRELV